MNIKLIRLTSGEEILAKIIEETSNGYQVNRPAIILPAGQGRLALVPWLPYAETEDMLIPDKVIAFSITPKSEMVKEYNTMVSGILIPDNKVATPKLTLVE
jgi:hypothetical protein